MQPYVPRSTVYRSQDREATPVPTKRREDKKVVGHTGVGKSGVTVVSTQNTDFILV